MSCTKNVNQSLGGAWATKGNYTAWKNGSKDVNVNKTPIGNMYYYVITNSIIIDTFSNPMCLSVPGGKWTIRTVKQVEKNKYALILESYRKKSDTGEIEIKMNSDSSISIYSANMSESVKKEIAQSFLELDGNRQYVRCDVASTSS